MESVIARLLSDFESGKLTRRQHVQTLALVAVGRPVAVECAQAGAMPVSAPPATPFKTVWLDHISHAVWDHKRSVDPDGWDLPISTQTSRSSGL